MKMSARMLGVLICFGSIAMSCSPDYQVRFYINNLTGDSLFVAYTDQNDNVFHVAMPAASNFSMDQRLRPGNAPDFEADYQMVITEIKKADGTIALKNFNQENEWGLIKLPHSDVFRYDLEVDPGDF